MQNIYRIFFVFAFSLFTPINVKGEEIKHSLLPKKIVDMHTADGNCLDFGSDMLPHAIEKHEMGDNQALYIIPCATGAYNMFSKFFLERDGEIEPLFFADYHDSYGWSGTDILVNFGYDPKTKRLSMFNKSAGHGGCGSSGIWRWHEYNFVMLEFQSWDDCSLDKAPENWPHIYKSKLK